MQLAAPSRLRARTIIVIITALMLAFGAPARAGDDDGVESARATALEHVNYKINSLKEYREFFNDTATTEIYTEGIEELGGIKARILEEDNTEEIWALKDRAKAVWAETKELAAAADADTKEDNDDDDDGKDEESEGTGGEEDDGAEETAIILIALNAMELEVDNYQIAIQNTMHPDAGIGTPEGFVALDAGWALLDAIDAARSLTGDELALAWAGIMSQHSAYIQLVMTYDREWDIGLFAGSIVAE